MRSLVRVGLAAGLLSIVTQAALAATLQSAFMSNQTGGSTCTPGPQVTSFPSTTATAWLFVLVNGAQSGDTVRVDWISRSNQVAVVSNFQPLTLSGSVCFNASLSIAGTPVATQPGNWTARVNYNGATFTSVPFTITGSSCVYAVNPLSVSVGAAGGAGTPVVVSTVSGCSWTAASNSSFLTITSGTSGTGDGSVAYTVAANNTGSNRTGTLTVAGQTVTITQAAGVSCAYAVNPLNANAPPSGGTASVTVSTGTGCQWTAVSNTSWLTITAGTSGTGNGSVSYSAAANSTASSRTGTMTIAGQTVTITQTGAAPCTYSLSPTTISLGAAGGAGVVTVFSGSGCTWTAVSNSAFVTITAGASGTGNGTVSYSAAPNTGAARNGTLTVAGQTFTISQAASGGAGSGSGPSLGVGGTYTLTRIEVTRTYPTPSTSVASSNPILPGFTIYQPGQLSHQVGWDFLWGGPPPTNRNRFVATLNLTTAPQAIVSLANATFAATTSADWNASGYGNGRDHTYSLAGVAGSDMRTVCCDPDVTGNASFSTSLIRTVPTPDSNGEIRMTLAVNLHFGDDNVGAMQVDLVYGGGANCTYSVGPASQQAAASGGSFSASVTAGPGCTWAAVVPSVAWLTIASGASGSGSGTITYTVAANSGPSRYGTITVWGQQIVINQAGSGSGTYVLNRIEVTRAYPTGSTSAAPSIPIQPGKQTYALNQLAYLYLLGWDFFWGTPPTNRQRFVGAAYLGSIPQAVTPGSPAAVSAGMSADWNSGPGYGVNRFHTISFTGAAGSGQYRTPTDDPNVIGAGSFATTASVAAPQPNGSGEVHLILNGTLDFGGDHVGTIAIDIVYTSGGSGPGCTYSLGSSTGNAPAAGGNGSFSMTASAASCAWTAASDSPWLHVTSTGSGAGNATVTYSADANTASTARTGTITIGGQNFVVTQAGAAACSYTISPANTSVGASAGSGSVTVSTSSGCAWTAVSNSAFLTVTSGASGGGNGTVNYSVAANTGAARSGTITIAGQTFTVNQDVAGGDCVFALTPVSQAAPAAGGAFSVRVGAPATCSWTSTSAVPWITITGGTSGSGNGTVSYTVAANPGAASRSGTLVIAGVSFPVSQSGSSACSFALDRTSATAPAGGANGTVALTASAGACAWTAFSNISWITVTAGGSGAGNGSVNYTVKPNTGAARSGTLTIGGQTFTVNQDAVAPISCSFSISPGSAQQPYGGGTGNFQVNASAASCTWSAGTSASWITITSGAAGTGSGTVSFAAQNNSGGARVGTITAAGQTFTISQDAAPPVCTYSLTPSGSAAPAAGSTGSITIGAPASCLWTAVSNATWISLTGVASGTGNGSVGYAVAANSGGARTGTVAISGQTFSITQAAGASPNCNFTLNPTSQSAQSAGGPGQVLVLTTAGCAWTAASNSSFVSVTAGASGSGNGVVNYSVAANSGAASRSGSLTIGGQTFPIDQSGSGAASCTFTLNPVSQSAQASGGPGQVAVTAATGCTWTAVSNAPWLTITSGASGNGSGTINYNAAANGGAARDGVIAVGGQSSTLHQAAGTAPAASCTYSLSPSSQAATVSGGQGTIAVTTSSGCSWTASSGSAWITISAGATGNGSGAVTYNVAANAGAASRDGAIVIGGQTFSITQPGTGNTPQTPCTYALNPTSESSTSSGGAGQVAVTTATGCSWTAAANSPWISITAGAAGAGSGTVTYAVAANSTGSARSGSMTVAGLTFAVTQPAGGGQSTCTFSLNPASQAAASAGGAAQLAVTTAAGCQWTATSSSDWITITSGGSGSGSSTVNYSIAPNTGGPPRNGAISVAGITFPITQPGSAAGIAPCTFTLNPTSQAAQAPGGTSQVSVAAGTGCSWTAASNNDWLTITSGGNGSGSGSVGYSVAANSGTAARTGSLTIAGQTFPVTQAGTSATVPCTYTFNPSSQAVVGTGGPGQVLVITITGCSWTAASDSEWLTITAGGSGDGTGVITYSVAAYASGPPRTGYLTLADRKFPVTQSSGSGPACSYSLDPVSQSSTSAGGAGQVAVTAPTGCSWTASSGVDWMTITVGATGNGSATTTYSVAPNQGSSSRAGTLTIAGQTFAVTQAGSTGSGGASGAGACTYSLSPSSQSAVAGGGTSQVTVTTATGCSWTSSSNADWLTISAGGSGSGSGDVTYAVAPYTGAAARTGTLTVAGQTFSITQSGTATPGGGCVFSLTPAGGSATSDGGPGRVTITAPTGCAWTATSGADWITITDGAAGSGGGTLTYSIAGNGGAARSGVLTIAGLSFPVNQSTSGGASPACTFVLSPRSQSAKAAGGAGQVNVTAPSGCSWTAASGIDWIRIISGAAGNGVGTVSYSVDSNVDLNSRLGTATIAGQTFQVSQDGAAGASAACSYSLSPPSATAAPSGGTGQVSVTSAIGCAWTATSAADWITIVAGAAASGSAAFSYSVAPNAANASRTGIVTVAGATFSVTQAGAAASSAAGAAGVSACTYALNPSSKSSSAAGGTDQVAVTAVTGCSWTASSSVDWISPTAAGGSGSGNATYSVAPNSGSSPRSGVLTIAGLAFTVTQSAAAGTTGGGASAGCSVFVNPASQSAAAGGGVGQVAVIAPAGCSWAAAPQADWLSISDGASGSGSGTVTYAAAANGASSSRVGTINISGQPVTITQGGSGTAAGGCTYSITPVTQAATSDGGVGQVSVNAGAGCSWTANTSSDWITITSGADSSRSGDVVYSVAANTGAARTGTILIAGQNLTVTQAGGGSGAAGVTGNSCSYSITPSTQSVPSSGGSGQFTVSSPLGCSWLAGGGADWTTVVAGGTGQGSGMVVFGAAANSTGAGRSATITVAGQTFTLSQDAAGSGGGPRVDAAVNAASFAAPDSPRGAIARGSFFTIFGSNIGPRQPATVSAYPISRTLADVSIRLTQGSVSVDAYPHFVSAGQVNAILPSTTPLGTVQLTLTYQGQTSNTISIQIAGTNWGSFSVAGNGLGPGIIQNVVTATQYDLNGATASARPAQIEILWGTGLGAIIGPDFIPPPGGNIGAPVRVTVGGVPATVTFQGRTPCCSAVDNIYFLVPANAPQGCEVPVQVALNGTDFGNTVTMAISQNGGQCSNTTTVTR